MDSTTTRKLSVYYLLFLKETYDLVFNVLIYKAKFQIFNHERRSKKINIAHNDKMKSRYAKGTKA